MQLTLQQIQSVTWGAVRVCQEDGGITFHRFTEAQEEFYLRRSESYYKKCFASSGVRLVFKTDSRSLALDVLLTPATTRQYTSLEIFVDGKPIGEIANFKAEEMIPNYTEKDLPSGEMQGCFHLGEGEKTVKLYLPWSMRTVIRSLRLDDGASLIPVHREKKLLVFGDSISQGYDALRPSRTYTNQLADFLDAEEFNKAIGGEVFVPGLVALREDFDPDYISIAYGTNDWNRIAREELISNSTAFYRTARALYPNAKILIITPIWRKDYQEDRLCGDFCELADLIREAAKDLPDVTVIEGFDFIPQDPQLFADLRLHPSDKGFAYYANSLLSKLKNIQ